jgi:ribosomal protein L29
LLYEKIRIQESSLEKGAQHYKMRVKEVDGLRQQVHEVQKELTGLGSSVATMNTLRNEVYQLQRELLQERTKVRYRKGFNRLR